MTESRWESKPDNIWGISSSSIPTCKNCGVESPNGTFSRYCPNCGAKMENAKYAIKETIYTNCDNSYNNSHKEITDYID